MSYSPPQKHLVLKIGQATTFLSAVAVAGLPASNAQQLGFLTLATAGLVCWGQASALHKDIRAQGVKNPEDKRNTLREYVIWGHALVATTATAALSDLTSPLTLGVLTVCGAALIANAVDNYQLLTRKTLTDAIAARRPTPAFEAASDTHPKI